ncbi:MAG: hypothetical protein N3B13_02950 [Deltaproteobacteria bacterium]|nr:hypothetical protein [Deltaproteobacteria bacterium]
MPSDFINYTFGKLIEDFRKILQAGVAGLVNEMIESKFREIEEIRRRIGEIERILREQRISGENIVKNEVYNASRTEAAVRRETSEKCIYEGCLRTAFSRGYCKNHYYQMKRKGLLKNIDFRKEKKMCGFEGCGNTAISRGLCKNHYYQYRRGSVVFENGRFIKKES